MLSTVALSNSAVLLLTGRCAQVAVVSDGAVVTPWTWAEWVGVVAKAWGSVLLGLSGDWGEVDSSCIVVVSLKLAVLAVVPDVELFLVVSTDLVL
jgi:hypothetical protein